MQTDCEFPYVCTLVTFLIVYRRWRSFLFCLIHCCSFLELYFVVWRSSPFLVDIFLQLPLLNIAIGDLMKILHCSKLLEASLWSSLIWNHPWFTFLIYCQLVCDLPWLQSSMIFAFQILTSLIDDLQSSCENIRLIWFFPFWFSLKYLS